MVPVGTGPSPDSIRALASVFGGAKGFVSHDVIVQLVRVEATVLTRRLYRLFPRHTLEEFLSALANVKHLRRLRTPRSAFATAAVLTEKEARLEFAFELYDLDGDGFVTEAELLEVVDKTMLGNAAKIASTLRVAMKVVGDGSDASENAFSNPVGVGTSTVSDHPRLDFQLFKKLAGRIPSVLFPAQTLYELLFEFGGGLSLCLMHCGRWRLTRGIPCLETGVAGPGRIQTEPRASRETRRREAGRREKETETETAL